MKSNADIAEALRELGAIVIADANGNFSVALNAGQFTKTVALLTATLNGLKELDVEKSQLADRDIAKFEEHPTLQAIRLNRSQGTQFVLRGLSRNSRIDDVFIDGRLIENATICEKEAFVEVVRKKEPADPTSDMPSSAGAGANTRDNGELLGCVGIALMLLFPPVLILFLLLRNSKTSTTTANDHSLALVLGAITVVGVLGLWIVNSGRSSPTPFRPNSSIEPRQFYTSPGRGSFTSNGDVHVEGHVRRNRTYVAPHYRSQQDSSVDNNWSSYPNTNPYTGERGRRKNRDK